MTTGAGVGLIGGWFGTGADRGMALIFIAAGIIGLVATLWVRRAAFFRALAAHYTSA
jgi:DHA3 family multidrug efflux protein-like MFS transporter